MTVDSDITVFIIDDDEMVRDSLKALLEAHRFRVQEFGSGRQYLATRDGSIRGCLLLDMHMPDMSGLDLLEALRNRGDDVPVVVFSGRSDPVLDARAKALGASEVLDKPVGYKRLLAAIQQAVAQKNG
jgi:two-component system, LuxR family, response regulator FixJ